MYRILEIIPFFSERLWGSQELANKYGFDLPNKKDKYGEAWVISSLDNGPSYVLLENNEKMSLKDFFTKNKELFKNEKEYDVFPLLSKIITANDYLSIQVHPDDEYSIKKHKMLGKPECWYIIDAPENAQLIYGHNAKTRDELKQYVKDKKWDQLFKKISVKKGDFVYVPPGKIHALTPKVTVFELQRSSDITYRFYDFDRKDKNGKLRPLHIEDSINVTLCPDRDNYILKNKKGLLIDNDYFTLFFLEEDFNKKLKNIKWAQITVIEGTAQFNNKVLTKSKSAIIINDNDEWDIKINGKVLFSYIK